MASRNTVTLKRGIQMSNHLVTEILTFRKCTLPVCLPDPHFRFAVSSVKKGYVCLYEQ